MNSSPASGESFSIGEVLSQLRSDFPDVTISKIRFLESEGLLRPQRTAAGYRKFSGHDVVRLRYILTQQRDHYLPLRIIKERLDGGDSESETLRSILDDSETQAHAHDVSPGDFLSSSQVRLSRDELLAETGLVEHQLSQLEQFGLLRPLGFSGFYNADSLTIARMAVRLSAYGIEPRHLRTFRTAADREIALFRQLIAPMVHQRNPNARANAEERLGELAAASVQLHAALVRIGLADLLS